MADSQSLFDTLAGSFGHGVDRPALNAFVANSQAGNGLRTAQTDVAIGNAQKLQDESNARTQLEDSIASAVGPDGKPLVDRTTARLIANEQKAGYGDFKTANEGFGAMLRNHNTSVLSDPTQLNTAAQTAAQQGIQGKLAEPVAAPNNMIVPAGVTPNVQQTAQGAAQTAQTRALTSLDTAKADAGGFAPHGAGAGAGDIDPATADFGAYKLYKTGQMLPLGMGNGPMRAAMIAGAAKLATREANGEDISNPGFDHAIQNGQDFTGAQRAVNSAAGGPLGNQARSLNNAGGHLQLMENLFTALQNGDTQGLNSLKNKWNQAFGSPIPTDIQTASQVIGPELTKILAGTNAGTGPERAEFGSTAANLANAPEQTSTAIGTLKSMLGRQAADLAFQYHGATGRSDFANRYVQPDVAKYFELSPEGAQVAGGTPIVSGAGGAAAAGPVKILGDDGYNKLPSGAHFIGPDGHERVKP